MYVAPRPLLADDPLYAIRLACAVTLALLLAMWLNSPMPMLMPAMTLGLIAGIRQRFSAKKAFGGPLAMIFIISFYAALVALTRPMPGVLLVVILASCVFAYFIILRSGSPTGMLLLMGAVLMSVMGMHSLTIMFVMRDAFIEACLGALIIIPLLYWLLPPHNNTPFIEVYEPDQRGEHALRALIRGLVLMLLIFWLYTVVDSSNIMLAMAGVFVLVFPTRERQFAEAWERTFATFVGGGMALLILAVFYYAAHISILFLLLFLVALFLGNKMLHGRYPPMVYQFALSVTIALVVGALGSKAPLGYTGMRIFLTLAGALTAAVLTSFLERLLITEKH